MKANAILEDVEQFDASFFDLTPKETEITDPQHRLFLECAAEALESSGYNPDAYTNWRLRRRGDESLFVAQLNAPS